MGSNSNSKIRLLTVIIATLTVAESLFCPAIAATRVNVSVSDINGSPIARAKIDISDPAHASAITDSKGRATLALATAGAYRYRVNAIGFRTRTGTFTAGDQPVVLRIFLDTSAGALHVIGSVTGHARAPFNATPVSQKIYPREAYRD